MERGSVIIWNRKLWFLIGFGKDDYARLTYRLIDSQGDVTEELEEECIHLISPSDIKIEGVKVKG